MKRKKQIFMYICLIASIFILLFDFYKYDIYNKADARSFGAGLAFSFLIYAIYGMYSILAIGTLLYIFLRIKQYKWKAFIPSVIMIATILLLTFVPFTKGYTNIFYSINKEHFKKTIQMYNKGELQYYQCDMTEYYVPYRLTSYIEKMYVQSSEDVTKIMFYAYRGIFKNSVLIYCSDDSGIKSDDFSDVRYKTDYHNIHRIDKNWYSAVISNKT